MEDDFEFPTSSGAVDNDEMGMDMDNDDFAGGDDVPVLKVGDEKEIGKTGVKKKLIQEGQGWERPSKGDEVEGTYTLSRSLSL